LKYYYTHDEDNEELPPKPLLILSNTITKEELMTNEFFTKSQAHKLIKSNNKLKTEIKKDENFAKYLTDNSVELVEDNIDKVEDAIEFMVKKKKQNRVLVEAGGSLINRLYTESEDIPIDILILSVYSGQLDSSCIGPQFASIGQILKKFKLVNMSDTLTDKSLASTFFMFRKSIRGNNKEKEENTK